MIYVSGETPRAARAAIWLIAGLIGAAVATVVLAGYVTESRDQREDLDLFLEATSDGWVEASNEFFRTPVAAANLIKQGMGEQDVPLTLSNLLATVQLDNDIDAAFVGRPDGSFQFAARDDADGFRTRLITPTDEGASVELHWFDAELVIVDAEDSFVTGDDVYDPRARPWYGPIAAGSGETWSEPYTFASSGQPGITYSDAIRDENGTLIGVVGIDVRLSALDDFLSKLRPGPNGQAALFDDHGHLIAVSPYGDGGLDVPDFDGTDTSIFALDADHTASTASVGPGDSWTLLAIADDADFVSTDSRLLALIARWLLVAAPVAIAAATLLRPVNQWFQGIYRTATRDPLTGLASRSAITDRLRRQLDRPRDDIAVAIVDLDGFKPVNDTWGHQHGDEALEQVGRRIREVAAKHGLSAGRLGGDEFLLFAVGSDARAADLAWDNLVDSISRPVHLAEVHVHIGASVGVAHVEAGHDRTLENVLRRCDRALYTVKSNGGSSWLRIDGAHPAAAGIDLSGREGTIPILS